ncbi:hypothetical protein MESS4_80078 [Mesorhizobium sp. STM 4661]|nr:hypothetical protein MESS4_80078 [Mesorhizobium sp. STM 4661]
MRSRPPPSVLPDISPARGEIGSFGAPLTPAATMAIGESGGALNLPPCGGDGRQARGGCEGSRPKFLFRPHYLP